MSKTFKDQKLLENVSLRKCNKIHVHPEEQYLSQIVKLEIRDRR